MEPCPSPIDWGEFDTPPSTSPPSMISSIADLSEPEEPSNELLVLDSLFPVVERLPGFTKHQTSGFYYVQGKIDQESLYDYTKRVGKLTLGAEPDSESRLAMHVLVRIARLQDPNNTLFSSLHHLRIARSSKYLDFLDIFLSSALTTIELAAISDDDPYYSSVLSFLESAVDQAPRISTLILGPGRIQDQILHISSKYQQLRRLEMRNVGISMTDQLLRDIGLLQNLETFVLLDNGTSTYKRSPEIFAIPIHRQEDLEIEAFYVPSPVSPVSFRWTRALGPPKGPPSVIPAISECATLGPRRQRRQQEEEPMYVPNPLSRSPSQGLSLESRTSYATDQVLPQISSSAQSFSPKSTISDDTCVGTPVGPSLFPALQTLEVDGSFSLIEGLLTEVNPSNLQILSIDSTNLLDLRTVKPSRGPIATTSTQKRKHKVTSKASKSSQLPQAPSAPDLVALLRHLIQTSGNTLVSVSLKDDRLGAYSLPSDLFENLLLRPNMKHLEITGIGIDSTDIKLHRLEEIAYSKLEVLHLPVHSTAASLAFVELQYIAENCPHLKSLRCQLRSFWDIPVPVPKSHGLEVLSVSNVKVELKQERLFKIARYLDSAFPNLNTIKTYDENGNNAKQWGLVWDLVKVCQAVRGDECARRGI